MAASDIVTDGCDVFLSLEQVLKQGNFAKCHYTTEAILHEENVP